jgi:hypothetical protein
LRPSPCNSFDKASFAKSMETGLLSGGRERYDQIPKFIGADMYSIYNDGKHRPYTPIAGSETHLCERDRSPCANEALRDAERRASLAWGRIAQHQTPITHATDRDPSGFRGRCLVADELLIAPLRLPPNGETHPSMSKQR